jgi:hypothetical protein
MFDIEELQLIRQMADHEDLVCKMVEDASQGQLDPSDRRMLIAQIRAKCGAYINGLRKAARDAQDAKAKAPTVKEESDGSA